ncbi:MAG: hypothetical protein JO316_16390 [Abitibacteriaceae bacterium]|nr:hypothetical protein [Abditibacteriaceae bacterium]
MPYKFLTDEQVEQFLKRGFIVLHDCFSREVADEWVDRAFIRLGYDRHDPATWEQKRIHMPSHQHIDVKEFAPKVWGAACELLGGEERVAAPYRWSDAFILNLGIGADQPWEPPSPTVKGWHKDGDFFRHFLDSPEQGLLTLVLWSDIEPRGGGTFVAADSVPPVARFLAAHPEGVLPGQFDFLALISECHEFVETTGKVGDVVLLHPYMLHTVSQNHLGTARLITNPPIHLREPMNFNREDPADFSLVEQAVLRGLGVERLDFQPTAPRERVVPERVKRQQKMLEEEKQRLAASGVS